MRLGHGHDVDAAVALPAGFVVVFADGLLLAEADHVELRGGNAHLDQVVLGGAGTPVAQRDVVLGGTALIAVALDGQLVARVIFQDVAQFRGVGLQGLHGVGAQRGLVVVEIGVFDFGQQLIDAGAGDGIRISLLRRRGGGRLRGRGTPWRRRRPGGCGAAWRPGAAAEAVGQPLPSFWRKPRRAKRWQQRRSRYVWERGSCWSFPTFD